MSAPDENSRQKLDYGRIEAKPPRDWLGDMESRPTAMLIVVAGLALLCFPGACWISMYMGSGSIPAASQPTTRQTGTR